VDRDVEPGRTLVIGAVTWAATITATARDDPQINAPGSEENPLWVKSKIYGDQGRHSLAGWVVFGVSTRKKSTNEAEDELPG
jgi:hypothetical protein